MDVIFHLAANFANQNSIDFPERDMTTNILGTIKLLERARKSGVSKFVYTNTSCMYLDSKPFIEDSRYFDYHTPYSISKHTAEHYVLFYHRYYKLPSVSVRVFNSYGPHEYPGKYRNVIPNFISKALNGESLTVMGDGTDTRSFTYVEDLIDGIVAATTLEHSAGEVFNIGNQTETKILELAETINDLTGNAAPIQFVPKRDWDKATRRNPDVSKAASVLGCVGCTELKEGLLKTIAWHRDLNNSLTNEKS